MARQDRDIREEEELDEFKATGEKSSVADPVGTKTPKRRADKDQGDKDYNYQGDEATKKKLKDKKNKTKPSMMSDAYKIIGQMEEEELETLLDKLNGESLEEDVEENERVELEKITTDDIDISEDVEAMFSGDEELSEEFKEKAVNVFESAVVSKVNEILENAYIENAAHAEAVSEEKLEEMTETLDTYLDYVVSEWLEENKLAVESGIRADIAESFMTGLKTLFDEHYIEIPEEKVDVVEELSERNDELEESINELTENNVELHKRLKQLEEERILDEISEDLTDGQKDKLKSLAEGISFKGAEDFERKLSMLKENYFGSDEDGDATTLTEDTDHPLALDEEERQLPANMSAYATAISRHAKGSKK